MSDNSSKLIKINKDPHTASIVVEKPTDAEINTKVIETKKEITVVDANGVKVIAPIPTWLGITNLTLLLGLCVGAGYKWVVEPRIAKWKKSLSYTLELENKINGILYSILTVSKADRVLLTLPHNGEKFTLNVHIWKVSIWKEVTKTGVANVKDKFINVTIDKVADFLKTLKEQKYLKTENVEDLCLTKFIRNYYNEIGVKKTVHCYVGDIDDLTAYISIHYNDENSEEWKAVTEHLLKPYINEIEALLARHNSSPLATILDKIKGN